VFFRRVKVGGLVAGLFSLLCLVAALLWWHEDDLAERSACEHRAYAKTIATQASERKRTKELLDAVIAARSKCISSLKQATPSGGSVALLNGPHRHVPGTLVVGDCGQALPGPATVIAGRGLSLRSIARHAGRGKRVVSGAAPETIFTFDSGVTALLLEGPDWASIEPRLATRLRPFPAMPTPDVPTVPRPSTAQPEPYRFATYVLFVLGVVAGGALLLVYVIFYSRLKRILAAPLPSTLDPAVSPRARSLRNLFDDLGGGGYALEVFRHYRIDVSSWGELQGVDACLADQFRAFGGYDAFVADHIASLEMLGETCGGAGMSLDTVRIDVASLLASYQANPSEPLAVHIPTDPRDWIGILRESLDQSPLDVMRDTQGLLDDLGGRFRTRGLAVMRRWRECGELDGRMLLRTVEAVGTDVIQAKVQAVGSAAGAGIGYEVADAVDADGIQTLELAVVGAIVGYVVSGGLFKELSNWWRQRHLRSYREQLTQALERLYEVWHRNRQACHSNLFLPAATWRAEAARIARTMKREMNRLESAPYVLLHSGKADAIRIARRLNERAIQFQGELVRNANRSRAFVSGLLVFANRHLLAGVDAEGELALVQSRISQVDAELRRLQLLAQAT